MQRRIFLLIFIIIGLLFSFNGVQGSYSLPENDTRDDTSSNNLFAEREGDLLSIDIRDAVLGEVLQELSRQNGITFLLPPSLAKEKIMVKFSHLKLDEGLRKILSPFNTVFVYCEDDSASPEPPATSLKEVKIYPYMKKFKSKETFITIEEGSTYGLEKVEGKDEEKATIVKNREEEEERSLFDLSSDLSDDDSKVRIKAVKALGKMDDQRAVNQLARALRDKNPKVQNEAKKSLKGIEESLKERSKEVEETTAEEQKVSKGEEVKEEEDKNQENKGEPKLTIGPGGSSNVVDLDLDSNVSVKGVQFTLSGGKPIEVHTTSRTEGFFAKVNKKNGMVVLVSFSGEQIKPGTGPIAQIVCGDTNAAQLSDVRIVK